MSGVVARQRVRSRLPAACACAALAVGVWCAAGGAGGGGERGANSRSTSHGPLAVSLHGFASLGDHSPWGSATAMKGRRGAVEEVVRR